MNSFKILSNTISSICIFLLLKVPVFAQNSQIDTTTEYLLRMHINAWSRHNVDIIDDVFAENGIYEDMAFRTVNHGREEIKNGLKENFVAVPDFKIELIDWFSSKNMLACQWIMSGTQTGDYPDLPATGKSFSVRGASIALIKDGKFERWTDYYDGYTFLKQLGVIPVRDSGKDN
jgi:steroid delta-isomerase-like uncharacterized protein